MNNIINNTLVFLWEPAGSGIRLLRCFGNSPVLTVPDQLNGKKITEIGAYCFSRSRPKFSEKIYKSIFIDIRNVTTTQENGLSFNDSSFDFLSLEQNLMAHFLKKLLCRRR